jgi:hypothetical protein
MTNENIHTTIKETPANINQPIMQFVSESRKAAQEEMKSGFENRIITEKRIWHTVLCLPRTYFVEDEQDGGCKSSPWLDRR